MPLCYNLSVHFAKERIKVYPDLIDRIDKNNRDWLRAWGCTVIQLDKAAICLNPDYAHYNGVFAINTSEKEAADLIKELTEKSKKSQASHQQFG